jgi:hypothetical protein
VVISESGANAFVRDELLSAELRSLAPERAYREWALANMSNASHASEQWNLIQHLDFLEV